MASRPQPSRALNQQLKTLFSSAGTPTTDPAPALSALSTLVARPWTSQDREDAKTFTTHALNSAHIQHDAALETLRQSHPLLRAVESALPFPRATTLAEYNAALLDAQAEAYAACVRYSPFAHLCLDLVRTASDIQRIQWAVERKCDCYGQTVEMWKLVAALEGLDSGGFGEVKVDGGM